MQMLQKIRDGFAYFKTSNKSSITLKEKFFWVVKIEGFQGIAIEIAKEKQVNESFSNVYYYTKEYVIAGQDQHLLLLVCDQPSLYDDFALICASFLENVLDANVYAGLQQNPLSWWHTMKELIGNANVEKSTHSVLGEMLSYYYLLKSGENVIWQGHAGASIDIEGKTGSYEVKSTLARYGAEITISSQYQLQANYLLFCRFEPTEFGLSIQSVMDKLIAIGVDRNDLDTILTKMKFPVGSEIRTKSYKILELRKFTIDEKFPKITMASFVENQLPQHITSLTYTIDLEGLPCESVEVGGIN